MNDVIQNLLSFAASVLPFVIGSAATLVIQFLMFPSTRRKTNAESVHVTLQAEELALKNAQSKTDILEHMSETIEKLHRENLEAASEIAKLQTKNKEQAETIQALQNQIEELTRLRSEVKQYKDTINQLKQELARKGI